MNRTTAGPNTEQINVVTDRLFKGKYDCVSCFGEFVYSIPDPLKPRKSLLLETDRKDTIIFISIIIT